MLSEFLTKIYHAVPDPDKSYIAWGSVNKPMFLTLPELQELTHNGYNIPQDVDLFFTPLVFDKAERKKNTAVGGCVAWIDLDSYKENRVEPLLPATFIISSGRGRHYYYLLDNFYAAEDIERANKALFAHVRQDGGEWSRAQLLRVPGSVNWKCRRQDQYPAYTEPYKCELVEFNEEYIYSLGDLAKLHSYPSDLLVTPTKEDGTLDESKRDFKMCKLLGEWGVATYAWKYALLYHCGPKHRERNEADAIRYKEEPERSYIALTIAAVAKELATTTTTPTVPTATGPAPAKRVTNAEVEAMAWLFNPEGQETGLLLRVWWDGGELVAPASALDFSTSRSVIKWFQLIGAGNRTFQGTDRDAKNLYARLVAQCPPERRLQVEHAGRYALAGQTVFIYHEAKALVGDGSTSTVYWSPKIRDRRAYLHLDVTDWDPARAVQILGLVQQCQVPSVLQPALGWVLATPLKSVLETMGMRFPVLLLYGFPGSGKSSLLESVLLPLLGSVVKSTASDSTKHAVTAQLGLTTSWPIWFGEFRASNANLFEFMQLLRECYDGQVHIKGRPDLSVDRFELTAPVLVDGENPFPDGATAERSVALKLQKEDIAQGSAPYHAFETLRTQYPKDEFCQFARQYILWTLGLDAAALRGWLEDAKQVFIPESRTVRVVNNYSIPWLGLSLLKQFAQAQGLELNVGQDKDAFFTALGNTYTKGLGIRTEADNVCERVAHFWYANDMQAIWQVETDTLWFNLTRAARALRITTDLTMLIIQLQNRVGLYVTGPVPLDAAGGAPCWGINIGQAQRYGLDIPRPNIEPHNFKFDTSVDNLGMVRR